MPTFTDGKPVTTLVSLSVAEVDLLADALGLLFVKNESRRGEVLRFGLDHPELQLIAADEIPEEER